jgi:hypothetical protein
MAPIALYYPWMHFQDDNWLKLALLTWDGVVRMRPDYVADHDQETVRQLLAETDFIVKASPSRSVLHEVAESFGEIYDADPERLFDLYGLSEPYVSERNPVRHGPEWRWYKLPTAQRVGGFEPPDSSLTWVYAGESGGKMASGLRASLIDIGLAQPSLGPWVGMHPKLASVYLAVLADVMGRREILSPVTDDLRMHNAVGALDRLSDLLFDGHAQVPAVPDAESAYMHVALRAVIEPDHLASVPVGKLIRFRERHRAELVAFHEHVAGLSTELRVVAEAESLEVASAHLKSLYETKTRPQLDDLRKALRGHGIESSAGTLVQKIDLNAAAGTVLGGVAAAGGQVAVASAAVAVTLVPYIAAKFAARRLQWRNSSVSYLLAVDRELSGRTLLGRLHRRGA